MKCFNISLTAFLFILVLGAHAGGGWPQPKGSFFLKLNQWWVVSDQHYTNTGQIEPNFTRGNFNTSFYGEYGMTERLTGIIYFPFFSRATIDEQVSQTTGMILVEGDAINSVGDTDISVKYGIVINKPMVVSATLTLGLPLGNDSGGKDGSLQTGDGELNQMISIDVSRSFKIGNNVHPFLSMKVGFNNRTNNFSDEFRYGAEAGITFKRFTGIVRLLGIKSLQNGEENLEATGASLFANNSEYVSFSPEIAYNFTDTFGISASYGTAFSGKLIYANPSYSFGMFLKL